MWKVTALLLYYSNIDIHNSCNSRNKMSAIYVVLLSLIYNNGNTIYICSNSYLLVHRDKSGGIAASIFSIDLSTNHA